jgi:preprotein translocase subunit SecD
MKVCGRRFNIFLALAVAAGLLCGCQTSKRNEIPAALRVYLETNPDGIRTNQTVSVVRDHPMTFPVASLPVLTEASLVAAGAIDTQGGFAIQVQFDEIGTDMLEQYTASNLGKHFVIYGQWGKTAADGRWLAAPLITRRMPGGKLVFTPDASRDEVNRLVLGLNEAVKQIHKGLLK